MIDLEGDAIFIDFMMLDAKCAEASIPHANISH